MMPANALSSVPLPSSFLAPKDVVKQPLIDLFLGGVDINNASQGLQSKVWTAGYISAAVLFSAQGVGPYTIITVPGITWLTATVDQLMNPFIAYQTSAGTFFRWFDTVASSFVTTQLPAGAVLPYCMLDDPRPLEASSSDIILAYVNGGNLYFRAQRERFGTEHLLGNIGTQVFTQMGMNKLYRMQFQFQAPLSGIPSDGPSQVAAMYAEFQNLFAPGEAFPPIVAATLNAKPRIWVPHENDTIQKVG